MKRSIILIIAAILVALVACQSHYRVETRPDGTVITQGDYDPKREAPDVGITPGQATTQPAVTFGMHFRLPTKGELANAQAKPLMTYGIILLVLAAASFVARIYFPIIPTSATTTLGLLGMGMIAASIYLPQFEIPAWGWMVALAAVGVIVLPGMWSNRKKEPAK